MYLDLDDTQIVKLLLNFFASRHQLVIEDIMITIMELFRNKPIDNLNLSVALNTALGKNYLGQLLKNDDKPII